MIFTSLRSVARVAAGVAAVALVALLATAVLPGLGIAIAVLFWLLAAVSSTMLLAPAVQWLLASTAGPARQLRAAVAPFARRSRRAWWVRLRIFLARLRVWTSGGWRDHCGSALLALMPADTAVEEVPSSVDGGRVGADVATSSGRRRATGGGY